VTDDPIKRARAHEAAGRLDDALAAYREVPAGAPAWSEARIRVVGIALLRGHLDVAEREARAFASARPDSPEPHATLGQVLRLSFRHDDAIASFAKAASLAPGNAGYRMLLNDARRGRYWSPDADHYQALSIHATSGQASPAALARYFHLAFVGLLNPDFQRWLTASEADNALPATLRSSLDARFGGRFSQELDAVVATWSRLREPGSPWEPARARVSFAGSPARDGLLEDGDGTVGAAIETIAGDEYALVPFGEIASVDFLQAAGAYVSARLTPRSGKPRDVEVPALYLFTEGCRLPGLREGRGTVWRTLATGLSVGLGLRMFRLGDGLVGIDRVKRIEILG
jgi:hypothetical protein